MMLHLDSMRPDKAVIARRLGRVRSDGYVELTADQYRYVIETRSAGDWLAVGLRRIGVAWAVKRVIPNCGCAARQVALNSWWERTVTAAERGIKKALSRS